MRIRASPPSYTRCPLALAPASEARRSHTISKWVDYSYKYGLGYQLSDGSVGVLFNDNTKMVLAADLEYVRGDKL